jgi:hypothetical protein
MVGGIERQAYRLNTSIHHIGRSHDVGSGFSLRDRKPAESLDRTIVLNGSLSIRDPVVSVIRIGIKRHIDDQDETGTSLFDGTDRGEKNIAGSHGMRSLSILERGLDAWEESHCGNAKSNHPFALLDQGCKRVPHHPGHRLNWLGLPLSSFHKKGLDQILGTQNGLTHHRATSWSGTIAPHPSKEA